MEARYGGPRPGVPEAAQEAVQGPASDPVDLEEAEANVRAMLPVQWSRRFDGHQTPDGLLYVDPATGTEYRDGLPKLHAKDGRDL